MPFLEKRIYSGKLLEIERYPVTKNGRRLSRGPKMKSSSKAQQNLNEKNARKLLIRLLNVNFCERDLFATLTYKEQVTEAQARKDITNYIRRLKTYRNRKRLPAIKYIIVIEMKNNRVHAHLVLSEMPMEEAERLWGKGRVTISRLEPDEYGFEALARYITKNSCTEKNKKRWSQSRNLKRPKVVKKEIKRMNIYRTPRPLKGYKIIEVETTDNIYTGTYQYITMVKLE